METVVETVEVPVLANGTRGELEELLSRGEQVAHDLANYVQGVAGALDEVRTELARVGGQDPRVGRAQAQRPGSPRGQRETPAPGRPRPAKARHHEQPAPAPAAAGDVDLTGPQQKVLDALAWLEAVGFPQPTKLQAGFIAGYRVGKRVGGTYGNILGQLRNDGLIDYPTAGQLELTDAGRAAARFPDIERSTRGLQDAIYAKLDGPERRVLEALVTHYPTPLAKREVGELAGYTVGDRVGGTFGNILGRLRSLGLIDYPSPGEAVALPLLFLEEDR